jgi:hypothetical protein
LVKLALHHFLALLFTFGFKVLETLKHLLADLLRSFLPVCKLLLVKSFLSSKHLREFLASLVKVGIMLSSQFVQSVFNRLLLDATVRFNFPLRG